MSRVRGDTLIEETQVATTRTVDIVLDNLPRLAVQANYSINSLSPASFVPADVNTTLDRITLPAHGFTTGVKGQFTTDGTLPSGLSTLTDYWIIRIDDDTISVADSLIDAEAGAVVLINSQGTGNHTFTPSAYSDFSMKLQSSNDGVNFVDLPSCVVSVASAGTSLFNIIEPAYRYLRFKLIPGSGSMGLTVILNGYDSKGDINAN